MTLVLAVLLILALILGEASHGSLHEAALVPSDHTEEPEPRLVGPRAFSPLASITTTAGASTVFVAGRAEEWCVEDAGRVLRFRFPS